MGRPPAQDARTSELERALTAIAILAGVLLRLVRLDAWSLWGDEVASLNLAAAPVSVILGRTTDLYPPLYSLFLHFWQQIGNAGAMLGGAALLGGEAWLRTPSALAGIATIGCVAWVALQLDTPRRRTIALIAAALLALSPLHIWYSREARMYAPAALLATAAAACYLGILKPASPDAPARRASAWTRGFSRLPATRAAACAAAYVIFMLLGIYTAYANVVLWLAGIVAAPILARTLYAAPALPRRYWLAQAAVALGFAPYLPVVAAQVSYGNFGFLAERIGLAAGDPATAGSLGAILVLALLAAAAALAFIAFRISRMRAPASRTPFTIFNLGDAELRKSSIFNLQSAIVLAFALLTVLGAIPRGLSIKRQLLVFWPLATVATAAALASISSPSPEHRLRAGAWERGSGGEAHGSGGGARPTAALLALSLALCAAMLAGGPFEDWRGAAAHVTAAAPSAAVYLQSAWARDAFAHYYRGAGPLYAPDPARAGHPGTWATQPPQVPQAAATMEGIVVTNRHPSLTHEVAPLLAWLAARGQAAGPSHPFPRYLSIAATIDDYRLKIED